MKFQKAPLNDAFVIELEPFVDDRGEFARGFCQREFEAHGLNPNIAQANLSTSKFKGTMRGLHYQIAPHAESKLVRCVRGSLFDVIVDTRKESSTFGKWFGEELTAKNGKAMYVPEGFAHAFLTLEDDTQAIYLASNFFHPEAERGIRFDDPNIRIEWPIEPTTVSDKDRNWADFVV